ncbi:MAG: sigma-70 family RNA polymerase sigma factor [Gammaproteobacteria bacterium]
MDDPSDSPEGWLDAHGSALYRYAMQRLRDAHSAEEVVQETLLAALQARERFSADASVRTWLIGILKHKILDHFRHQARTVALTDSHGSEASYAGAVDENFTEDGHWRAGIAEWGDPEVVLEQGQFWEVLHYCLERMPTRLARLFILREIMETETENICQELAITPTNVWTMLYRARLGLRQCLARHGLGKPEG